MKKVAIVTDGWVGEVTYAWFKGSRQYLDSCDLDADLYFFHSFGNFSKDEEYNAGEYNIVKLPGWRAPGAPASPQLRRSCRIASASDSGSAFFRN